MFLIPHSWYIIKKTREKGRGVFAMHDIAAGTVIGDYLGTVMDPAHEDEKRNGLYTMIGGETYDILGNPRKEGVHLINHSCAHNCDIYPYRGHVLYFASRKIFKGEEIAVDYWLYIPDEKGTTCAMHACHCGSQICSGTMHHAPRGFDSLEKLWKKNFGIWYRETPGKYGKELPPLEKYPAYIEKNYPAIYDLFGSESKSAAKFSDKVLPSTLELRKRIRETGRQISFPKLRLTVYGIQNRMLLMKRK